jgi:hypothetical protein
MRIRFESMAMGILFELVEKGNYNLVWSFILEYENSRNPFVERRLHTNSISTLCRRTLGMVLLCCSWKEFNSTTA